jgi:hypothetical protein
VRKFYCDKCGKEVKVNPQTGAIDLHPLFLVFQEQDIAKNQIITLAGQSIEVCKFCRDVAVEDGHDAVKLFKEKTEPPTKKT